MADRYWNGSVDGDWNTAANWTPAAVPLITENVFITDTAVDIDDYDNSGVLLGNVTIGPGYTGNIGTKAGLGVALSFGADHRLSITGAPLLTTQNFWIDINSANDVDVDLNGFGNVTVATMGDFGLHLKRTASNVSVTNNAGALSLDSGTFNRLFDMGTAQSIVNTGVVLSDYRSFASGVNTTLEITPVSFVCTASQLITVNGTASILLVTLYGGNVNWDGGGDIGTQLFVFGGTFDTSNAIVLTTIQAAELYGSAATTTVDLTMAELTTAAEVHGTPSVIWPQASQVSLA